MLDATGQILGREPAIRLVRSFMDRPELNGKPRSQHYPVIVFEGAHGSGKTTLLDTLVTLLDQRVPYACLDFEAIEHAAVLEVNVPEVLSALACELSKRCPQYGVLHFPRFTAGRLVMRQRLDPDNDRHACEQVTAVLNEKYHLDTMRQILQETAGAALDAVRPHTGVTEVAFRQRFTGQFLDRFAGWIPGRRLLFEALDWYGRRGRPHDAGQHERNDVYELVKLNRWARNYDDEDNRQRIAQLLWDAFLADLVSAFDNVPLADELALNCVILLDNADTTLGRWFVNQLVQARREYAAEGNETPDPMSVVVTSRGTLLAHVPAADQVELPTIVNTPGDPTRQDDRDQPWWGRYRLEDLTRDQIGAMVSALALREGNNHRLTSMTLHLTAGHPASTRLLLDAVAEYPAHRDELSVLLDQPEPDTPPVRLTVAERMRQRLLADFPQESFDDLVTFAASRERQHALQLATSPLLASQSGYVRIIDPVLWPTTDGAGPSLLRRLLLRELAQRDDDDPLGWSAVFTWHRTHCAKTEDAEGELYYALADHDLAFVAKRMHEHFTHDNITQWLDLLTAVISAPRPRPGQDGPAAPMDEVHALLDKSAPPASLQSFTRLIAALWVITDPLCGRPRRGVHLLISADYTDLAKLSLHGAEQLLQEAQKHSKRAEEWN